MSDEGKGHLAMLLFAALVAGSFALGGIASPFIDPFVMTAMRFVIAAAVLWGIVWATGADASAWKVQPWRYAILAFLYASYFVMMFEGLQTADPVSMAAVFTLNPGMTAVFGYFVIAQITTRRMMLAIVIGAIGALWVIFRAGFQAALAFEMGRGELIYFVGCIGHSLLTPLLKKFNRGEPTLVFNGCILVISSLGLMIWCAPILPSVAWAELPSVVWITLLYIATMATVVSLFLLRYAAMRIPSAKVMAYTYIVPSFVIIWQIGLGFPIPSALLLPGVGLTVLSLLLLLKNEDKIA